MGKGGQSLRGGKGREPKGRKGGQSLRGEQGDGACKGGTGRQSLRGDREKGDEPKGERGTSLRGERGMSLRGGTEYMYVYSLLGGWSITSGDRV